MFILNLIDNLIQKSRKVDFLVTKVMDKVFPSIPAAGACPGGYEFYADEQLGYECWASTSCGSHKCVKVFIRHYYYVNPVSYCDQLYKICNYTNCSVPAQC